MMMLMTMMTIMMMVMTMVMVLILVMVMVIYSVHSEYRNYTLNVDFRLRNSSGRATTIAAPYSSCSIYN